MTIPAIALKARHAVSTVGAEVLAVLVRITIGQAFVQAGLGKLMHHDRTATFFAGLGIPAPGLHAWAIGGLECVGGALLILGLATRPVAALLLCTMAVAILTADRGGFVDALAINPEHGLTEVVPWMFGLLLLVLLAHGAGRLSLDHLRWSHCCGKKPAEPAKT